MKLLDWSHIIDVNSNRPLTQNIHFPVGTIIMLVAYSTNMDNTQPVNYNVKIGLKTDEKLSNFGNYNLIPTNNSTTKFKLLIPEIKIYSTIPFDTFLIETASNVNLTIRFKVTCQIDYDDPKNDKYSGNKFCYTPNHMLQFSK